MINDDFDRNLEDYVKRVEKNAKFGYTDTAAESDTARITDTEELDKILDMSSTGPQMLRAIIIKVNHLQSKFSELFEPLDNLNRKIDYLKSHAGEYHHNEKISSQINELTEFVKDLAFSMESFSDQFRFQRNAFEELEREEIKHHAKKEENEFKF